MDTGKSDHKGAGQTTPLAPVYIYMYVIYVYIYIYTYIYTYESSSKTLQPVLIAALGTHLSTAGIHARCL